MNGKLNLKHHCVLSFILEKKNKLFIKTTKNSYDKKTERSIGIIPRLKKSAA